MLTKPCTASNFALLVPRNTKLPRDGDVMVLLGKLDMEFNSEKYDSFCWSQVKETDSEDLFAWLAQEDGVERTLGELETLDASLGFAAELNNAGAVNIWALDIERATDDYKFENSSKLCVELPSDYSNRSELIGIGNQIANAQGFDSVPTESQRYLYIAFD